MDALEEELLGFWNALNGFQVHYIMVGGFATRFHGFTRNTDDLDLWIEDTIENRTKLREAIASLGYGDFKEFETMQFLPGWTSFTIGGGLEIDIITEMKGLEHLSFSECLDMASIAELDDIKVPFLHINHLIANKKMVNRLKDQIDVLELEKIRSIREAGK